MKKLLFFLCFILKLFFEKDFVSEYNFNERK